MDLESWLRQGNRAQGEWPRSLDGIRTATGIVWERPLHRQYTDHSTRHSQRVIEKLGKLTEELVSGDSIAPTEVFILLAAAYLHDIGMQHERFRGCDLDQIRIHHHELTRRIIAERYLGQDESGIPLGMELVPTEIVDTIASVAEAHRQTDLRGSQYDEFAYGDGMVRPRLLAALLRLADELDIDSRRVPMQLLGLMDISAESEFHWTLCYYVSGVHIQDGLITIHYKFPEGREDYDRIIEPIVRARIEEEFPTLRRILWEHGCKVQMNDEHKVRFVPGLQPMSSEALEFALEENRRMRTERIDYHSEEIRFCDTMASAVRAHP